MFGFAFKLDDKAWVLTETGEYKSLEPAQDYLPILDEADIAIATLVGNGIDVRGRINTPIRNASAADFLEQARKTGGLAELFNLVKGISMGTTTNSEKDLLELQDKTLKVADEMHTSLVSLLAHSIELSNQLRLYKLLSIVLGLSLLACLAKLLL